MAERTGSRTGYSFPAAQTGSTPVSLTVVSLFAGCGGSSCGYRAAGFTGRLAVEYDAAAAETYRANFPGVPTFERDVRELTGDQALGLAGVKAEELDVMDGSPPCQGFSLSGKRKWEDPRNGLWREYVRLLGAFKPKACVFENVRGLVVGKMRVVFAEILKAIKAAGYRADSRILDAARYGVPQHRRRVFIVGIREDLDLDPAWPAPSHALIPVGVALRDVVVDPVERATLLAAGARMGAYGEWPFLHPGEKCDRVRGAGKGFSGVKLNPLKPAGTITRNDGNIGMHGMMHWAERRRLTLAEARIVAGFPASFAFPGGWADGMHQIGNCVPPPLTEAVARQLISTLASRTM